MSKALAKIKRLRSKPIFICDICCPRVGNDRRRCLLDESLFLFFFFSFFFFYYDWGRNWRERFPKTDGYQRLAHTRIDNWSFEERIVWQPRRGLGLFYWEKDKKICNLEPRVISAPLKMSRNDPGLEIEKKKNNSKKITNQIHINALLTKWKVNLAGYWPNGESAIHKKNLHANYFFFGPIPFNDYTLQWFPLFLCVT